MSTSRCARASLAAASPPLASARHDGHALELRELLLDLAELLADEDRIELLPLGVLVGQDDELVGPRLGEAGADGAPRRLAAHAGTRRCPVRSAARSGRWPGSTPNSPLTLGAVTSSTLAVSARPLRRHDLELDFSSAIGALGLGRQLLRLLPSPRRCCRPCRRPARAGRRACPATISSKPSIVSLSGTYLPSAPVNCEATKNGCERKRWILRARATTSLSSSLSSSMPRMAMMSCRSLYFWRIVCTWRATS